MKSARGFTLIELLVVIAIMAVIGTFAIANFGRFGEDRNLDNAALDIQSLLRSAQTNATTGLKCSGNPTTFWKVNFFKDSDTGQGKIETACQYQGIDSWFDSKTYSFKDNINLTKICGDSSCTCQNDLTGGQRLEVWLTPISGTMTYNSFALPCPAPPPICPPPPQVCPTPPPTMCLDPSSCFTNASNISVNLQNTKTTSTKQTIIEKGGRIYVQ